MQAVDNTSVAWLQKKTTGKRLSGYNMYIASRTAELQSDSSVRILSTQAMTGLCTLASRRDSLQLAPQQAAQP